MKCILLYISSIFKHFKSSYLFLYQYQHTEQYCTRYTLKLNQNNLNGYRQNCTCGSFRKQKPKPVVQLNESLYINRYKQNVPRKIAMMENENCARCLLLLLFLNILNDHTSISLYPHSKQQGTIIQIPRYVNVKAFG